MINIWNSRED